MKAKKTKYGSWQCRVYDYQDSDGKQHYKTFTVSDPSNKGKKKCEALALEYSLNKKKGRSDKNSLTFADALESYIAERSEILSPASIRKYRALQRNHYESINNRKMSDIDQDVIQALINEKSKSCSPKTVRDIHGLITAVLKRNNIVIALNTTLPKKSHVEYYIPTDEEIKKILEYVEGTTMELPVMLGAFAALRRGEVSALDASDLDGNVLHVRRTMVDTPDHTWVIKDPKSYAGDRYVTLPQSVADMFPESGKVTDLKPNQITSNFEHIVKNAGVNHITFHSLRHWNTSMKHSVLGIPDAVIQKENGWSNDRVMKEVYRHAVKEKEYASKSSEYFDSMIKEGKSDKT